LSEITEAIAARQTQITQLQNEIETLQHAASVLGTPTPAAATPTPRPKSKAKPAAKPQPKAKQKSKRRQWTAAEKAAIGKRMKAYWAKRRKAKG
jgi:hypothetical protein